MGKICFFGSDILDYFYNLVSLLIKNEINGESVLITGNNIDNENSILSKKKNIIMI